MSLKVQVLASGSRGNCIWVASEKVQFLVDAGLSGAEISRRIKKAGGDLKKIDAIVVSHEHRDHISSVGVLSRRYDIPVFMNRGTLESIPDKISPFFEAFIFQTGTSFSLGDFNIHPFSVPHDASDPVGFVLKKNTNSLGICTDLGKATKLAINYLKKCNVVILESNHDDELLINGPYPWELKRRIKGTHGHLSNEDAVKVFESIYHSELKHLILAHLSEVNNHPDIVRKLFLKTANREGWCDVKIKVSAQDDIGEAVIM